MNTLEFLKMVWPDQGLYCMVGIPKRPGLAKPPVIQLVRDTIEQVAVDAPLFAKGKLGSRTERHDVYFNIHALKQAKVWDAKTEKWRVRTHENARAARCFFADLDIGESTPTDPKFPDRISALRGVQNFLREVKLPAPTVVSSGGGFHIYWSLIDEIDSREWKIWAQKLHALMRHYNFHVDHSRVDDESSVLRIPGTWHYKNPEHARPVQIYAVTPPVDTKDFLSRIDAAFQTAGITQAPRPIRTREVGNIVKTFASDSPPPRFKSLFRACEQVKYLTEHPNEASEPQWRALLNTVRFCEDGDHIAHLVSMGYNKGDGKQYSKAQTDDYLERLKGSQIGPTTCGFFQDLCGESRCEGCPWKDKKTSSPIVRARQFDPAPPPPKSPPSPPAVSGGDESSPASRGWAQEGGGNSSSMSSSGELDGGAEYVTCDPPAGYIRLRSGGIGLIVTNDKGRENVVVIYPYDLYPIQIIHDPLTDVRLIRWRTELPQRSPPIFDFVMPAADLYDLRAFAKGLSSRGIWFMPERAKELNNYMIAYIKDLQKYAQENVQHSHLGWTRDFSSFILPRVAITKEGPKIPLITQNAENEAQHVTDNRDLGGSYEVQRSLMHFYNHDEYIARQFVIACAFGAPLFRYTGQAGAIIHLTGETGHSKSTALYTAASVWGHPTLLPIDGTKQGATPMRLLNALGVMANLPIFVDEITKMTDEAASELVFAVSQYNPIKKRLERTGEAKKSFDVAKSTIMLTTGNTSLHEKVTMTNDGAQAGAMRVFEIPYEKPTVHGRKEAEDYLIELGKHYGFLGPAYMQKLIKMPNECMSEMNAMRSRLDKALSAGAGEGERFWTSIAASALVGCKFAYAFGLIPYDYRKIMDWLIEVQFPRMRAGVRTTYRSPIEQFCEFLNSLGGRIGVVNETGKSLSVIRTPQYKEILGRYNQATSQLYVSASAMQKWCKEQRIAYGTLRSVIGFNGVATDGRASLGRGLLEFTPVILRVLIVDMKHELIAGKTPALQLVGGTDTELNEEQANEQ